MKNKIISEKFAKILLYILLFLFAITILLPVLWVFVASIKDNSEFYGNPWAIPAGIHLENFYHAFVNAKMGEYFINSVIVTSLSLIILLVIALPASYALSRYNFKGNTIIKSLFMGGLFINVNYIVVPIFLMLVDADKLANTMIGSRFFLNNIFVLCLVYASTALPFTIYLLSSYIQAIPKAYEEAAAIDGAGYFKTMIQVILPMAKPSIITVVLFQFLAFWNEYIIALTLMPDPNSAKTLPVGLMNLMAAQKSNVEYGTMYAGLVIVMLPTLILYMFVQKKLTMGMTAGGVKG